MRMQWRDLRVIIQHVFFRVDVIINNMAETFHGYIINARTKHLMFILEDIRTVVMQRLFLKKKKLINGSMVWS